MGGLFTRAWNALKWLVGLILPVAGKVRGSAGFGRGVRWFLHVVVLVAVLVGLHFLNQALKLDRMLPGHAEWLRQNWLPILFFLFYVLCWLGWWLWKLLIAEDEY